MKCSSCGGELHFENGVGVCKNCQSVHRLESVFENTDVCICYIENDKSGRRTKDSLLAEEIYKYMESKKISCFCERISAAEATGDELETLRYTAACCAKIIVLVGTSVECFETLSEKYGDVFEGKTLMPVIRDIKPDALPENLKSLQVADFDSLGVLNNLSVSILNMLGRGGEIELEEIYQKKQKSKKIFRIVLFVLLAVVACMVIAMAVLFWPEKEEPVVLTDADIYTNAVQLTNEKQYLEAASLFSQIAAYKDSVSQYKKIYDRYDGYYYDETQNCSLYLNVIDGKTAEFSFEKTVDSKLVKVEDSLVIDNNKISGKYIDSLLNEGTVSICLSNDGVKLITTTDNAKGNVSFGAMDITFPIANKTDRPSFKSVTKEMLLNWLSEKTSIDDVTMLGVELEYVDHDKIYDFMFGSQYKIVNTDITLIATDKDLTKYTGQQLEKLPTLDNEYLVAALAPVEFVCSEKIGQDACVFAKDNMLYVPNTTEVNCNYEVFTFTIERDNINSGISETFSLKNAKINTELSVGVTSKKMIGECLYNEIFDENIDIYYRTLVKGKYCQDFSGSSQESVTSYIAEKTDDAFLINAHACEKVEYGEKGTSSFNYYRLDLKTKGITLIKRIEKPAAYGQGFEYKAEEWKKYPEAFKEFLGDQSQSNTIYYHTGNYTVSEASGLNIRKTPSADSAKVGFYKNNTSVYVDDVYKNWGHTEKGWICLDYTTPQ